MAFSYIKSKLITTNTFSSLCSKNIVAVGATKNSLFMPHCSTILSSKFTRYSVVPVVGLVGVGRLQHNINHTHCFLHTTKRFCQAKTEPKSLNWSMRWDFVGEYVALVWCSVLCLLLLFVVQEYKESHTQEGSIFLSLKCWMIC